MSPLVSREKEKEEEVLGGLNLEERRYCCRKIRGGFDRGCTTIRRV